MKTSKILMSKAGIYPPLKLMVKKRNPTTGKESPQSTGKHLVRLISDKVTLGRDRESGEIVEMVKYVMEVNGEKREYKTRMRNKDLKELSYLVQILSRVPEGTEVYMEMKKAGPRNYVEVTNLDGSRITYEGESDEGEDVTEEYDNGDDEQVIDLNADDNEPAV